jgi:hypothetical protein
MFPYDGDVIWLLVFQTGSIVWHCLLLMVFYQYCYGIYSITLLPRREMWDHKTILTPPLFIGIPLPRQQSEQSCLYVLWIHLFQILDSASLFCFLFNYLRNTFIFPVTRWTNCICTSTRTADKLKCFSSCQTRKKLQWQQQIFWLA